MHSSKITPAYLEPASVRFSPFFQRTAAPHQTSKKATMMMLRPSSRLFQRVARAAVVVVQRPQQTPVIYRGATSFSFQRCFSSKENAEEQSTATITFTDDASVEHPEKKTASESIDISEFTQEIPIVMPDMGESTGTCCLI